METASGDCLLHSVSIPDIGNLAELFATPVQVEGLPLGWHLPEWLMMLAGMPK